jgi:hypothetical protein
MHLLSALINKVPTVSAESPKKSEASELPSVKLFKRMTTLKMEKTELELECAQLRSRLEEVLEVNSNLEA